MIYISSNGWRKHETARDAGQQARFDDLLSRSTSILAHTRVVDCCNPRCTVCVSYVMIEDALSGLRQQIPFRSPSNVGMKRLAYRQASMSRSFPCQRGVHEVYTTIHGASVNHLASYDILRAYTSDLRSYVQATHFDSAFRVRYWAYRSTSFIKELSTFFCFGHVSRLPRVKRGC